MSARRIARELAVILMPQLPKDRQKLSNVDYDVLIAKSVHMLVDYAKQCLSDANAVLIRASDEINDIELDHPKNASVIKDLAPVPVNSGDLKQQIENIERAIELVSEALDIPEMAMHSGKTAVEVKCRNCDHMSNAYVDRANKSEARDFLILLVTTLNEHRDEIDDFIKKAKAKWQLDRMVSIDRDILRLACAEAFFIPEVPVNVCISEAVELAHRFGDKRAAKFINGILGDLSEESKYFRNQGKFRESLSTGSTDGALTGS